MGSGTVKDCESVLNRMSKCRKVVGKACLSILKDNKLTDSELSKIWKAMQVLVTL